NLLRVSSSKYDSDLLYFFLSNVSNLDETLKDATKLEQACKDFIVWTQANPDLGITEVKYEMKKTEANVSYAEIFSVRYADRKKTKLGPGTLNASEIIELRALWKSIQAVAPLPVRVQYGSEEVNFETYDQFHTFIMENTKKGFYIQRYKGLGEMNPDQLWETTLNPENRNLLQVTIDDAVAADETFSVLMGEHVEPRRKFIRDNALLVRGLDI